jgi:penicillin-binding protein 1C
MSRYALVALVVGIVLMFFIFLWFSRDLPSPGKLIEAQSDNSTRIYDRNGIPLYSVYENVNRSYVKLDKIPKTLQNATIATEDKDFYKNQGFSVTGYIRGLILNPILHQTLAGGSTITQQLVKNVLLGSERTIPRKVKELVLSIQVDKKYSKDQILEMYLNDVPYGGSSIGVEAASESYFGKKVNELDLAQSAMLAGLPQAPSVYSPYTGNKYYIGRTKQVLDAMQRQKYITKTEHDKAYAEVQKFTFAQRDSTSMKAPHFVIYVKQILAQQFGEAAVESGGLQVTTSLDYGIQKQAEDIVKKEVSKLKVYHATNGAAVVTSPKTGEVLAMVGSADYFDTKNDGNFNVALANRQPGSSLKPIMYATAFQKGYTAATMVMDAKTDFPNGSGGTYTPVNYDGKFRGPVQLRYALGNSYNIPAVKMLARTGVKDVMQQGYEMGIQNWNPTPDAMKSVGLSLVLGGRETTLLNETTAYGVFANKGVKQDPVTILEVKDNKGHSLYKWKKKNGPKVLSEDIAFIISHILLDNSARTEAFGPYSLLNISGKTVSVKTGTTDQKRDNWTIGYTPSFVVGVWVGNNDNTPMNQAIASGITGASPIWNKIMTIVLKGKKDESPAKPNNVVAVQVDSLGGGMPTSGRPTRAEYFVKGTEPTSESAIYKKKDDKIYFLFRESDPVSTDGVNRWQAGIDAWIEQYHKDDPLYHPSGDVADQGNAKNNGNQPTSTPTPTLTPTPTGVLPTILP